jgi:hypothetical protein
MLQTSRRSSDVNRTTPNPTCVPCHVFTPSRSAASGGPAGGELSANWATPYPSPYAASVAPLPLPGGTGQELTHPQANRRPGGAQGQLQADRPRAYTGVARGLVPGRKSGGLDSLGTELRHQVSAKLFATSGRADSSHSTLSKRSSHRGGYPSMRPNHRGLDEPHADFRRGRCRACASQHLRSA